jgi:two-component SAPR family response regulator
MRIPGEVTMMKFVCVDDERLVLDRQMKLCREVRGAEDVQGFTRSADALAWLEENPADICLLDIDMPDMNSLLLAAEIKKRQPDASIIFVTGFSHHAADAIRMRASGYLVKPVAREQLERETEYALSHKSAAAEAQYIEARTFGTFELLVDGETVKFKRSKAKELLAYAVALRGESVRVSKAYDAVCGDAARDPAVQKQLYIILSSLHRTLVQYGAEGMIELEHGSIRAVPEAFGCDLYRFLDRDMDTVNRYGGAFMESYAWADLAAYIPPRRKA